MKKLEKILFITVFFCILPVANLFALSKEATEAIEQIRAKLHQQEIKAEIPQKESVSEDEYVPGRELSAALARIRRERFSSENKTHKSHNNKEIKDLGTSLNSENIVDSPKEEINKTQNIESEIVSNTESKENADIILDSNNDIENSINVETLIDNENDNISEQTSSEKDELIIIEAMEADDSEAWAISVENKEKNTVSDSNTLDTPKSDYVPGQLLSQSVKRIRHSRKKDTPASEELDAAIEEYEKKLAMKKEKNNSLEVISKANDEIDELFNNPEKRADLAEKERNRRKAQIELNSTPDEKQIDDKKFNDYISKYDFKMPENYRILVE